MEINEQINLNYFKFFIEAAESNSLAEVSEKTGYDSSTVSANIARLEKQMGIQLFTRNPLKLTEIGEDIYNVIVKSYRDLEFANVIAKSKNDINFGKISIGCPLHITDFYLFEKIEKAMKEHPNLEIKLDCESNYKEIIKRIKSNTLQFALLDFKPIGEDIEEFEIKEIFKTEYIFVSNSLKEIKSIEELNNYKYITSDNYRYTTANLKHCFEKHNVKLNRSMICSTVEARINAAKRGLGIAYVIRDSVKKELEKGELYKVKLPIELPKSSINLIFLKDRLTKVDKEFLKEYLKI